jgi:hypothetical protein
MVIDGYVFVSYKVRLYELSPTRLTYLVFNDLKHSLSLQLEAPSVFVDGNYRRIQTECQELFASFFKNR